LKHYGKTPVFNVFILQKKSSNSGTTCIAGSLHALLIIVKVTNVGQAVVKVKSIANKYREEKLKRTLKREPNSSRS
jgi:hypothetical protein